MRASVHFVTLDDPRLMSAYWPCRAPQPRARGRKSTPAEGKPPFPPGKPAPYGLVGVVRVPLGLLKQLGGVLVVGLLKQADDLVALAGGPVTQALVQSLRLRLYDPDLVS